MKSLREQDRTFGPVFLKGVVVSTAPPNRTGTLESGGPTFFY